jgi:hypothetical protein
MSTWAGKSRFFRALFWGLSALAVTFITSKPCIKVHEPIHGQHERVAKEKKKSALKAVAKRSTRRARTDQNPQAYFATPQSSQLSIVCHSNLNTVRAARVILDHQELWRLPSGCDPPSPA